MSGRLDVGARVGKPHRHREPEALVLARPDVIQTIHEQFLAVGADIVETDTFNANNSVGAITFNREGFGSVTNGTLITLHASPASQGSTRCLSVTLVGLISTKKYGDVDAGGNTCQ